MIIVMPLNRSEQSIEHMCVCRGNELHKYKEGCVAENMIGNAKYG